MSLATSSLLLANQQKNSTEMDKIFKDLADLGFENKRIKTQCCGHLPDPVDDSDAFITYNSNLQIRLSLRQKLGFSQLKKEASSRLIREVQQLSNLERYDTTIEKIESVVKELLETHQADPRVSDDFGELPINLAINNLAIAKMLYEHHATLYFENGSPHNPLHHCRTIEGFRFLFNEINCSVTEALNLVNEKGDNPIICLLKLKPDPTKSEDEQLTEEKKRVECLIFLFQQVSGKLQHYVSKKQFEGFCKKNFSQNTSALTLLKKSFEACRIPTIECLTIKTAIEKKDFIRAQDIMNEGVKAGKNEVLALLKHAKTCKSNKEYIRLARYIISCGDFNGTETTALHMALEFDLFDLVENILKNNTKESLSLKDKNNKTVVDLALQKKNIYALYLILKSDLLVYTITLNESDDIESKICMKLISIFHKKNKNKHYFYVAKYITSQMVKIEKKKNKTETTILKQSEISPKRNPLNEVLENILAHIVKNVSDNERDEVLHKLFIDKGSVTALAILHKNDPNGSPNHVRRVPSKRFGSKIQLLRQFRSFINNDTAVSAEAVHQLTEFNWKAQRQDSFNNLLASIPENLLPKYLHSLTLKGAEEKFLHILQNQLKEKIDLNLQNEQGYTYLHSAVFNDNDKCVAILVENGADAERQSANGLTAHQLAYLLDSKNCIRYFLKMGKTDCLPYSMIVPDLFSLLSLNNDHLFLRCAVMCDPLKLKEALDKVDEAGNTIFHYLTERGSLEAIKELWRFNQPIHKRNEVGLTLLEVAIVFGMNELIEFYLMEEPQESRFNGRGHDIIALAREYSNKQVVEAITKKNWLYQRNHE